MDTAGLRASVGWLFREAVVDLRAEAGLEAAPSVWRGAGAWAAADSAAAVWEEASMAAVWLPEAEAIAKPKALSCLTGTKQGPQPSKVANPKPPFG